MAGNVKIVDEVMSRDVEVMNPNDLLREAAEQMRALNVGALPVCDNGKLVGVITDRDIVVRAIALGHDPQASTVADAMTDEIEYVERGTPIEEAARIMREKQIRRLPVLDENRNLVGIVSLGDLAVTADERTAGEALEGISEPSVPSM